MMFLLEDECHKTFSQIAKESGFRFNLYRGRIDWKKLDVLDVDRLVRDLDMEMLNVHTSNVINCNLDTEYDVKILDPNFVKLFRIAQLTIDFLLHCKNYLERQLREASAKLKTTKQEMEGTRKHLQVKKVEVKQLKKKLKQKIENDKTNLIVSPKFKTGNVQCNICGKLFVDDTYLQAHQARRHAGMRLIESIDHTSFLKQEIEQLKDRLQSAELRLHNENCEKVEKEVQVVVNDQELVGKKYQDEIKQLKDMFFSEMQKLKENAVKVVDTGKEETLQQNQPEEERVKVSEENWITEDNSNKIDKDPIHVIKSKTDWEGRLEERETIWRTRLSAQDQEHKKEIRELQEKLKSSYNEGLRLKSGFEQQLQDAKLKVEGKDKEENNVLNQETTIEKQKNLSVKSSTLIKKPVPVEKETISIDKNQNDSFDKSSVQNPHQLSTVKRRTLVSQKTFQEETDSPQEYTVEPTNDDYVSNRNAVGDFEFKNKTNQNVNLRKTIESKITEVLKTRLIDNNGKTKDKVTSEVVLSEVKEERAVNNIDSDVIEPTREPDVQSSSSDEMSEDFESDTVLDETEDSEGYDAEENTVTLQKQLALQSLHSMEEILASNPEILKELKIDLVNLLERRLQDLGIDSEWSGVPNKTFKTKMAVLKHHQKITAKRHTGYFTLRDHLLQSLDERCVSKPGESKYTPKQNIISRLRKRATQFLSMARPNLGLAKKANQKLPAELVPINNSKPPQPVEKETSGKFMEGPLSISRQNNTEGLSQNISVPEEHQVIPRSAERVDRSKEVTQSIPSIKEFTVDNEDLSDPLQEIMGRRFIRPAMDYTLTRTQSEYILTSSSENEEIKSPLDINQPVRIYKSALRSSASTGNLAKKKVVFLDELFSGNKRSFSDDMINTTPPPEECSTPRNSATSVDKIHLADDIEDQPSSRERNPGYTKVVHSTPRCYTLQLPKAPSPASSLTSIGSSLLDISPTEEPKSKTSDKSTLEWNLEDIEENLKSD